MPAKQIASSWHKSSLCIITQPTIGLTWLPGPNSYFDYFCFSYLCSFDLRTLKAVCAEGAGESEKRFPTIHFNFQVFAPSTFAPHSYSFHLHWIILVLILLVGLWWDNKVQNWWDQSQMLLSQTPTRIYLNHPYFCTEKRIFHHCSDWWRSKEGMASATLGSIPLILGSWFLNGHPPKSHHMMVGVWDGDS